MKLKLDENLGRRIVQLFREIHSDLETVYGENLVGSTDDRIYRICQDN